MPGMNESVVAIPETSSTFEVP